MRKKLTYTGRILAITKYSALYGETDEAMDLDADWTKGIKAVTDGGIPVKIKLPPHEEGYAANDPAFIGVGHQHYGFGGGIRHTTYIQHVENDGEGGRHFFMNDGLVNVHLTISGDRKGFTVEFIRMEPSDFQHIPKGREETYLKHM